MFAPLFIAFTLTIGYLLLRLAHRGGSLPSLRGIIELLVVSLIAPSFIGLALVVTGSFSERFILLSLLGVAVVLGFVCMVCRPEQGSPAALPSPRARFSVWILSALLIGAVLRYPSINFVRGGQDPGVYTNIANSLVLRGRLTIVDPIAEPLAKRTTPLGKKYFSDSYRAMACKPDGGCRGSFQPGFYLRGIAPSDIVPQFYHLHPIWMAYSHLLFGGDHTTAILPIFGLLCLAIFFLLLATVCRSHRTAAVGTLLLACSPAYAYFARFPVSEVTTSLFFLTSLYFFTVGRLSKTPELIFGAIFAGLFFFTHITGFMFLALLYPPLLFAAMRRNGWGAPLAWSISLALFLWSFIHGLTFSRPYSMAIWTKIGIPEGILDLAYQHPLPLSGSLFLLSLVPFLIARRAPALTRSLARIRPKKSHLAWAGGVIFLLFGAYIAFKGYRLGFTDHYATNRWVGRRWNLSGHGLWSVKHLTAVVLAFFVSPVILLLAGFGWTRALRRSLFSPPMALLTCTALGLTLALVGKQTTAPYLYYFGRYLVPTLVPLAVLFGALALEAIRLHTKRVTLVVRGFLVLASLGCLLPYAIAQARANEGGGLYTELRRLATTVGPKALIFVDEVNFARVELTTPLQISFGIPTITYSRREFTGAPLRELMAEASALGYTVYLLSEKDRRDTLPFLKRVDRFDFFLGSFIAPEGSVMPTVFRAGRQSATLHRFDPTAAVTTQP